MNQSLFVVQKLFEFIIPLMIFLTTLILGYILRKILFSRLSIWAEKTKFEFDDIIISAAKCPFIIWCLMLAIYFALETSRLPQDLVRISSKILLVLGIISVTLVLANISIRLIRVYSERVEGFLPLTSLTQNITRIIIFSIGILIILNSLGISITPILATLGVGGLAVALALQDTLSNLFSGFYITLAKQIRIGDFVKLETGEEGYVEDIGWRATESGYFPTMLSLFPIRSFRNQ
jgi:small-conductance mechanosensitive channel